MMMDARTILLHTFYTFKKKEWKIVSFSSTSNPSLPRENDKVCEVHLTSVCILSLSLVLAALLLSPQDLQRAGRPRLVLS